MESTHQPAQTTKLSQLFNKERLLAGTKIVWIVLAIFVLGLFIFSLRPYIAQQTLALRPGERRALAELGLSVRFHTIYSVVLDTIIVVAFTTAAAGIFWRTSVDWVGRLTSVALLTLGVALSPSLDALARVRPTWELPILLLRGIAIDATLAVFYIFPDGRFVPRWLKILVIVWIGWAVAWFLFPFQPVRPEELSLPLQILSRLLTFGRGSLANFYRYLRVSSMLLVLFFWFGSGVFAQIYRYTKVATPVQRQQTKWVVFGLTAAVVGYFGFRLPLIVLPTLRRPGVDRLLYYLIGEPISVALLGLAPISFGISISRYRLWTIDPIIQRTLVYGTLTGALGVVYFGSVILFQQVFRAVTGYQSTLAIAVSTLVIAALIRPLRSRLQDFIDRRFYREKIDFRRAFTTFSREVRTIIELPELLNVLVTRTTELLHISHGAVFLRRPDGSFRRAKAQNLPADQDVTLSLDTHTQGQLWNNLAIARPEDEVFHMLVPLIAPRTGSEDEDSDTAHLVGVLALGPRLSGQDYSREDQALLTGLADQAGTAIYVAQIFQEKQEEARRREEAERHLEAYRNSPLGRADAFAQTLLAEPEIALVELYQLAQTAGQNPDAASLVDNLPTVLESLGAEAISDLAEGFDYLLAARTAPEMVPVGLRTLIARLEEPEDQAFDRSDEALEIYRTCLAALDANSIPDITHLLPQLRTASERPTRFLADMAGALSALGSAAEALYAYERLDTSRDRLAYLASAVEQLRHVGHIARTELGGADQILAERISERWLAVVTNAMSDLQTQARIVCRLLTRHTWQGDIVSLALQLRNEGRGAAMNVRVTLAPTQDYTAVDDAAVIERLIPGEEARVELRTRPHLRAGEDRFRARFIITYTDPRGPDQVEHFADVVKLLEAEGDFTFIPNPYVVGTPLETGSPLFFGREDLVTSVQENLAAGHRNNLVLIGQRRTGKTSFLKQLPARLDEIYLPVYLDGQTLGLDPGLPNFFLNLATEIAFALDDGGFEIALPELGDFTESPAAAFEHDFLARARAEIDGRHLLIMFDEFEELESAVDRGNLEPSVFGFLRHLIQHSPDLTVIFCGTHRLEELASDYWSVLFNISLYQEVGFLKKSEAMRLIQEPVATYGMQYDDLTLDKMWRVTAGHPYFLQLLCHSLVNRHNRTEQSYVTVSDLNAALDEILASGEAHFVYLWTEATDHERLALTALSRMIPLTGRATPVQVVDYFAERGLAIERQAVNQALHRLALRGIVSVSGEGDDPLGEAYRWQLGLLGLWVEKYKSLSRVIDEVRG
jgi:hypothetical protein